jgi:DNA-binding LacI/PurR family transcriptional regulator
MVQTSIPVFAEQSYMSSIWFSRSILGIKTAAKMLRVNCILIKNIDDFIKLEDEINSVIIISSKADWTHNIISQLRKMNLKLILTGATPSEFGEDISGTVLNRRVAVNNMVYYLYHCGRRRLASVGNDPNNTNDNIRYEAFLNATNLLNITATKDDVFFSDSVFSSCIERFLDKIEKYDGVICPNDYVAVSLLKAAKQRKIRVPDELFITGAGNLLIGQCSTPTLTTFTMDYYEMGVQAVNIWDSLRKDPKISSMSITIPCELICRGTTNFIPPPKPYVFEHFYKPEKPDASKDPAWLLIRKLEECLSQSDRLDLEIIRGVIDTKSIESIAEELFVAPGTINYRLKKMYSILGVSSRSEFYNILSQYIENSDALTEIVYSEGSK